MCWVKSAIAILKEVQQKLKTQEKLLAVAKKVRNALTLAGIFAAGLAIAKKFGEEIDAIGKPFIFEPNDE